MNREELDLLILRYLHQELNAQEMERLKHFLSIHPESAVRLLELSDEELLFLEGLSVGVAEEGRGAVGSSGPPELGPRKLTTRRFTRRVLTPSRRSWGIPGLVAAVVLLAVTAFLVFGPLGPDSASSDKAKEARARASQEAEARRQAERDRLARERATADSEARRQEAEAQAKRLEVEAHLREIEEKRRVLTQAKPKTGEDPQATEKREKDLAELKRDQERIEQELKDAVQLAKKSERPAPATPPQEEKPKPSPAAPGSPSQGTTQAPLAKVEEISGEAFVVTKDGKSPVTAEANLLPGQGLETGGGTSRIVLRFSDKTRVDLGPETLLAEVKTDSGKRLALTQGTVRAVVAKQPKGEPLIFTTPYGDAKVVGTTLRLYVDPDPRKGTKLEVEEGKVELKNLTGRAIMVESGHYAVAAVGVELVARVHRGPHISPNGSVIYAGKGGSLVTSEGTWTFGGISPDGVDSVEELNGVADGWATEMEIVNGSLYAHNTYGAGSWWLRQNGTWVNVGPTAPSGVPQK
jgi:hypothetical protein